MLRGSDKGAASEPGEACAMHDPRLGASFRALRRRRGWRQRDVARLIGGSQQFISKVECGHIGDVTVNALSAMAMALDARVVMDLRWRGAGLDRLLDERHAALLGATVALLQRRGWSTEVEATYSHFGERGSVDILGWHSATRTLLVVEVKSELVSIEATLRKLDEKTRLAPGLARERFGWQATSVGRLLVLPSTSTERRRVARHAAVLDDTFPLRYDALRSWLAHPTGVDAAASPSGRPAGILFVADTTAGGPLDRRATPERVRTRRNGSVRA